MTFDVDKKQLTELYEFHTMAEIARMYSVNAETVRKRIHALGVPSRGRGPRRMDMPSKQQLHAEYQKYSMKKLSFKYGVGETTIWNWLHHYGIKHDEYSVHGHRSKSGVKFSAEARRNMSLAKRGKWTGEKNPNWKGGSHQKNLKARASGEYKQWRVASLERANYACESCKVKQHEICNCCGTKIKLHVHHKKSFADFPDLRFDPENSEVLCPACHNDRHNGKIA